ncbi:MAG: T9SS type A sorting domain-containing protein, partial [Bacteroidia bacterium]
ADYSGFFSSDIDSGSVSVVRKGNRIRTTAIANFRYQITSISVRADNAGLMLTCGSYKNKVATVYTSNGDVRTLNYNITDNSAFTPKNGSGLPLTPAYSSLFEMSDNKRALIGTEVGLYSTTDITAASPAWVKETGTSPYILPNVPVFQVRQQTLRNWECYNSGMIYIATHGRGLWYSDKYLTSYMIGVEELKKNIDSGAKLKLYPNPTSDNATVWFNNSTDAAAFNISVYDVNGRVVLQQLSGRVMAGEQLIPLNTSSLNNGVYFVNVSGSNNFTATSKLVITR